MSDIVDSPTMRAAESSRVTWPALGRLFLFRAAAVLFEAVLVSLIGEAVIIGFNALQVMSPVPEPRVVAFVYALVLVLTNATPAPPRFDQKTMPLVALGATFAVFAILKFDVPHSLLLLSVWFAFSMMAVVCARQVTQKAARSFGGAIMVRRSVAFIGNSDIAAIMLQEIRDEDQPDVEVLGFFDDRVGRPGPLNGLLQHLGTVDQLVDFIHEHELDEVYVALPWSATGRITSVINRLRFLPLTVRLLPDHLPPALQRQERDQFRGVVLPTLMMPPMSPVGLIMKRIMDVLLSGLLLLALSPVFLTVALLIKLDSRGPVFFTQPRSGQWGRQFQIFKFRSLHVAKADAAAETLVSHGDSRVTRVGRFIRKYSIDEIPQILNVFLGDMSLVGPRPHAQRAKANGRIYAQILDDYMLRYRVKPGMTGWAQVNGWRGNTDTEEKLRKRVEFDFIYITKWSFWLDLRILMMTFHSAIFPPADNA